MNVLQQQSLKEHADTVLRAGVAAGDVPGVAAMATTRDGMIYAGSFGKRVLGQDAAMTTDTVARIASMTKAITGTAAMQLVEQGKLDLESPASRWLPALDTIQVLDGWDANGQPRLRPPKRPITLRHLLTHTSGFAYEMWNPEVGRYQQVTGLPPISTCKNAALMAPLMFDPGEQWEYGISIDWVGKLVEAVSGKRLGAYLQENLFAPLGMHSTAFHITPAMQSRMAKVHQRGADGQLTPLEPEQAQAPEFEMGGGGLYSTVEDYLQFVHMILNHGKSNGQQVLAPATVEVMSRNAMGNLQVKVLKTVAPTRSNDAEFFPGLPKSWGLSFMINDQVAPTGRSAGSLAWAGLTNTYYWIDLYKGVGGVYISQILPFADVKSLPLFYAFEQSVYQALG